MTTRCTALALGLIAWLAFTVQGADQIRKIQASAPLNGRITEMSPTKVAIETPRGVVEVPVSEILIVTFDGEPIALKNAKNLVARGSYEEALGQLEKVEAKDGAGKDLLAEIQYYKAFATAKLALAGAAPIADAGRLMIGFYNENPNSYHALEAAELIGDLLVANRTYERAVTYYAKVGEAPWPEYKMRANLAIGKAMLAEGKAAEASKAFDAVIAITAQGEAADRFRAAAHLGKIRCTLDSAKPEDVIKTVEDVIAKTDPEQVQVMAVAYNILGTALKKAGKTKEALMAFLHVDVLYYADGDAHAEALANLAVIWNELQQTERAIRARRMLDERYPNSSWATRR